MDYASPAYWDERYASESDPFEWLNTYAALRPFLLPHLRAGATGADVAAFHKRWERAGEDSAKRMATASPKTNHPRVERSRLLRVLVAGCGTSTLARSIVAEPSIKQVVAVDLSPAAIALQREWCKELAEQADDEAAAWTASRDIATNTKVNEHGSDLKAENENRASKNAQNAAFCGLTFQVGDVRALDLAAKSCDLIIDKGTIDTLYCGEDADEDVRKAVAEYSRVLAPGGVCVVISCGAPDYRLGLFQEGPVGGGSTEEEDQATAAETHGKGATAEYDDGSNAVHTSKSYKWTVLKPLEIPKPTTQAAVQSAQAEKDGRDGAVFGGGSGRGAGEAPAASGGKHYIYVMMSDSASPRQRTRNV